jgi:hypothetical protein
MLKKSRIAYEELSTIVVSEIVRRTYSMHPLDTVACKQFDEIFCSTFSPVAEADDTVESLKVLNSWCLENDENIVSACFFGSVVAGVTTNNSISFQKKEDRYITDKVVIGSSDVDGLIVVNKPVPLPCIIKNSSIYDKAGIFLGQVERNMLDNVVILEKSKLQHSYIFSDDLFPMYYRMLCHGSYWVRDSANIKGQLEKYNSELEFDTMELARKFYGRRISALTTFFQELTKLRVDNGFLYGTGFKGIGSE